MADVHRIKFRGIVLIGIVNDQGEIVVPIKPICDGIGLDWSTQQ
jgi:hypothetical protein